MEKLSDLVGTLRRGDYTIEREFQKQTRWLVTVLLHKSQSRYGRFIPKRELRQDIQDSVSESAVMSDMTPMSWAVVGRPTLRDIEARLRDRIKNTVKFRRRSVLGVDCGFEPGPRTDIRAMLDVKECLESYTPPGDVVILRTVAEGGSFKEAGLECGISKNRAFVRFKRCVCRLRLKLKK